MKILITGGATQEPIDQVRIITNKSSGRTAATIADTFLEQGSDVTYVHGMNAILPHRPCTRIPFQTHAQLDETLTTLLASEKFDGVIHLAAVSDYTVESVQQGEQAWLPHEVNKISSHGPLTLHLKPTKKLVHHLKEQAHSSDFTLIAFKLTATLCESERLRAVEKLTQNPAINYIVHNDLHDITSEQKHVFTVYSGQESVGRLGNAHELSSWLVHCIKKNLK